MKILNLAGANESYLSQKSVNTLVGGPNLILSSANIANNHSFDFMNEIIQMKCYTIFSFPITILF